MSPLLTAGVVSLACLIAGLSLSALGGRRSGGWVVVVLGAAGVLYTVVTYPQRLSLVIVPLSVSPAVDWLYQRRESASESASRRQNSH
jgi:hypothetical protein